MERSAKYDSNNLELLKRKALLYLLSTIPPEYNPQISTEDSVRYHPLQDIEYIIPKLTTPFLHILILIDIFNLDIVLKKYKYLTTNNLFTAGSTCVTPIWVAKSWEDLQTRLYLTYNPEDSKYPPDTKANVFISDEIDIFTVTYNLSNPHNKQANLLDQVIFTF